MSARQFILLSLNAVISDFSSSFEPYFDASRSYSLPGRYPGLKKLTILYNVRTAIPVQMNKDLKNAIYNLYLNINIRLEFYLSTC